MLRPDSFPSRHGHRSADGHAHGVKALAEWVTMRPSPLTRKSTTEAEMVDSTPWLFDGVAKMPTVLARKSWHCSLVETWVPQERVDIAACLCNMRTPAEETRVRNGKAGSLDSSLYARPRSC